MSLLWETETEPRLQVPDHELMAFIEKQNTEESICVEMSLYTFAAGYHMSQQLSTDRLQNVTQNGNSAEKVAETGNCAENGCTNGVEK